jgi:GT2 family glycosyltransferase
MKVSVVILNWYGCDMLRTFLPSVVRYSKGEGIEVCVADNGSTDDSVALLQQEFPSVRTIVLDRNYGFADGYNLALQQVDAEYVVLLNSDVEVTEHWLEPMVAYLDAHRRWLPVSRRYVASDKKNISNMPGQLVVLLINTVILSVGGD